MTETEHPWIVILRRKLCERGFKGDPLAAEVDRLMARFPFLRAKAANDPKTDAIHRAIRHTKE